MSFGKFQFRRGTAAAWTSANPTLAEGELGLETDTLAVKLGDGATAWTSLAYFATKVHTGSGVPSGGLGTVGDLYIRSSNGELYLKTAVSTWTSQGNLTGPQGIQGNTGAAGVVQTVTAANGTLVAGGTAADPNLKRAAITGDVGVPDASNTSTIGANAVTNAKLAQMVQATLKGRAVGAGTGDPADLTQTQITAMLNVATGSLQGAMSASDKSKLDNLWYDVTNYGFIGNDSFDNGTVWDAFFDLLPVGATVYFPPGTYRTSTVFLIDGDKHLRFIGGGKYTSIIKATNTTQDIFRISISAWYNTWEDMGFQHSGTPTAGSAINIDPGASGSAVGTNIYRCWFNNLFIGIRAVGQQAANLSVWDSIDISSNVVNSRGCLWTGEIINMIMSNSTINLGYPPFHVAGTAAMEITHSGAIQLIGGEYIGGTNTLLLNGSAGGSSSVAAIYATNCFFDQSAGSTVKITGTNIVNRVKFVQCGITGGNIAGATAVEIANTGSGAAGTATARADGVDFFDCDIYPNGGSGTTNGFLITGAQGVAINSCRISGWTNGIAVTPSVSNGYTKININNNKLGATNNFTTPNTVGILLNAGSFNYGPIIICDNDMTGSTTPLSDASTIATATQKKISDNVGMLLTGLAASTTTSPALTTTDTLLVRMPIPANGLQIGDVIRAVVVTSQAGSGNPSIRLRYGVNGTTADTALVTHTPTIAAAAQATFFQYFTVRTLGGTGTCGVVSTNFSAGIADTTTNQTQTTATPTIATNTANFLSVTASISASTLTVHSATLEVL